MRPLPTVFQQLNHPQTLTRHPTHLNNRSSHTSLFKQSHTTNTLINPYKIEHNQRISTVSSQKISVATRADHIFNTSVLESRTPRSQAFNYNLSSRIYSPQNSQKNLLTESIQTGSSATYQIPRHQRKMSQRNFQISAAYGIPFSSNQVTNHPQIKSTQDQTFTNSYMNKPLDIVPNLVQSITLSPIQPKILHDIKIIEKVKQAQYLKATETSSWKNSTVVQTSPLIGSVSVQNFQLPSQIRAPKKRQSNRLYKSAVYQRGYTLARPLSRAHSTATAKGKSKKNNILIRCPHRSFISNKKIPVIGAYVSNDKSKSSTVRELSSHHGSKTLATRIIGMELIDIIPTEVIKIPIGKAQDLRQSKNSIMLDDFHQSMTSNLIIDQPTLIKQYSPVKSHSLDQSFSSSRSKRLGDNIKISVYRSPDVLIKKAQIITSGPKLTKQHVMRIPIEGKVISPDQYEDILKKEYSHEKSLSPIAKYVSNSDFKKLEAVSNSPNPYMNKDIDDILSKFKYEAAISTRQNAHITYQYTPASKMTSPITSPPKIILNIEQSPIFMVESRTVSDINTEQMFSSREVKQRVQAYDIPTRASIQVIECYSEESKQQKLNPEKYALKKLSEARYNTCKFQEENTGLFEFKQTFQISNQSQSKFERYQSSYTEYKIPSLPQELEEDLRKFRLNRQLEQSQKGDYLKKYNGESSYL